MSSDSPAKRPAVQHRTTSTNSLSSSGPKHAGAGKRPHLARAHSRHASSGRVLTMAGRNKSLGNIHTETRNHQRKKSGNKEGSKDSTTTASVSPRSSAGQVGQVHMKRNSSHALLPKNRSHGQLTGLRKNQSASTLTALHRNLSRGALNKLGAAPEAKAKAEREKKQGVFDLGSNSDEEEEAEWEDSTASPELTRNNSKATTPARVPSPRPQDIEKPPDPEVELPEKTSSPPAPAAFKPNKSDSSLQVFTQRPQPRERVVSGLRSSSPPPLLQSHGRGSRAPPAVSTTTASALSRNESSASISRQQDTRPRAETTQEPQIDSPGTPGLQPASSGSAKVSHFLPDATARSYVAREDSQPGPTSGEDSDDSVANFMSNYKPQASNSPEKPQAHFNKPRLTSTLSRTQARIEMERKETLRGSRGNGQMGYSAGSSISLGSRAGSAKSRSSLNMPDRKSQEQDYNQSIKTLMVVRRFRNPTVESLNRLKAATPPNVPIAAKAPLRERDEPTTQRRPPSRRGPQSAAHSTTVSAVPSAAPSTNASTRTSRQHSPEAERRHPSTQTTTAQRHNARPGHVSFQTQEPPSQVHARHLHAQEHGQDHHNRVSFQLARNDSHDEFYNAAGGSGPPTSRGSVDTGVDSDGMTRDEALIRRMWEFREVAV